MPFSQSQYETCNGWTGQYFLSLIVDWISWVLFFCSECYCESHFSDRYWSHRKEWTVNWSDDNDRTSPPHFCPLSRRFASQWLLWNQKNNLPASLSAQKRDTVKFIIVSYCHASRYRHFPFYSRANTICALYTLSDFLTSSWHLEVGNVITTQNSWEEWRRVVGWWTRGVVSDRRNESPP